MTCGLKVVPDKNFAEPPPSLLRESVFAFFLSSRRQSRCCCDACCSSLHAAVALPQLELPQDFPKYPEIMRLTNC